MVNQLNKFSPNLASHLKPLHELLSSRNQWRWDDAQENSFLKVKAALTSSETLYALIPRWTLLFLQTHHLTKLEQSCGKNNPKTKCYGQWPIFQEYCQTQRKTTHRSKRKHWPLPGLASASKTISLVFIFRLKRIANHWYHYCLLSHWTSFQLECKDSFTYDAI